MHLRVRAANASALTIAETLTLHPEISEVLYPGLTLHRGHRIAAAQMHGGFGGMLSIRLNVGEGRAREVAARLQVFRRTTSLGCVESLVEHRASVEGPGTLCPPDLLRLSISIEPVADRQADLNQALE